jgi:hypothetical protein
MLDLNSAVLGPGMFPGGSVCPAVLALPCQGAQEVKWLSEASMVQTTDRLGQEELGKG